MPELPEVETTRRGVAPALVGHRIVAVRVYDRRLRWPVPAGLEKALAGREVVAVDRRSKYLLFRLAAPSGTDTLLVHLGMTGSLRVYRRAPPRQPHDHVDIVFDHRSTLRYRDPRRFGTLLWIPGDAVGHPLLASLGAEPFSPAFNADALHRGTRGRRVAIKLALMDNKLVVGVGNIYANEALFRAGIRPTRAAGRLTRVRLAALVDAVRATLAEAIAAGGSTLRDYVDPSGQPGAFQLRYAVYGREGERCRICRTPIRAVRQGQRSTFYCPVCQR
ncbi:MAG: bifunctional DNA-formamidopyrimidine glycosylase/DNA-(apurinic or apyrimidinic site) lyase [Betaproteobacteria bacterium]